MTHETEIDGLSFKIMSIANERRFVDNSKKTGSENK